MIPALDYKTAFVEYAEKNDFPSIPAWYPEPVGEPEQMWKKVTLQWDGAPGMGDGVAERAVIVAPIAKSLCDRTTNVRVVLRGILLLKGSPGLCHNKTVLVCTRATGHIKTL